MALGTLSSLLYFSRTTRVYLSTLAAVTYLLFPRFASWQISTLRYNSLCVDPWNLDVSLELDVGVDVYNPNHLPATLYNATMDLYRVRSSFVTKDHHLQAPVYGGRFGVATAQFHEIPRRGSFPLESHVSIVKMPFSVAMSFLKEVIWHRGLVKVRVCGSALVHAAKHDLTVWVDCLQHVNIVPFPGHIIHSACTYQLQNRVLGVLEYVDVSSFLEAALESFDFTTYVGPLEQQQCAITV